MRRCWLESPNCYRAGREKARQGKTGWAAALLVIAGSTPALAALDDDARLTLRAASLDGPAHLISVAQTMAEARPEAAADIALESLALAAERAAFIDPAEARTIAREALAAATRRGLPFDNAELHTRILSAAGSRMATGLFDPDTAQYAQAEGGWSAAAAPLPGAGTMAPAEGTEDSQDGWFNDPTIRNGWLPFTVTGGAVLAGIAVAAGINTDDGDDEASQESQVVADSTPAAATIPASGSASPALTRSFDRFDAGEVLRWFGESRDGLTGSAGGITLSLRPSEEIRGTDIRAPWQQGRIEDEVDGIRLAYEIGAFQLVSTYKRDPGLRFGLYGHGSADPTTDPARLMSIPFLQGVDEGYGTTMRYPLNGQIAVTAGAFFGQAEQRNGIKPDGEALGLTAEARFSFGPAIVTLGGGLIEESEQMFGRALTDPALGKARTAFLSGTAAVDLGTVTLSGALHLGQLEIDAVGTADVSAATLAMAGDGLILESDDFSLAIGTPLRIDGPIGAMMHGTGEEWVLQSHYGIASDDQGWIGGGLVWRVDPGHDDTADDDITALMRYRRAF